MKMAMILRHLTLVLLSLLASSAFAAGFENSKEFKRDRFDFELGTNYFYSNSNYTSGGSSTQGLPSGNHFQVYDMFMNTRYMPQKTWSLFGAANIANSESRNAFANRTNSSLSDVTAGADFLIYSDSFQLIPEVSVLVPFEKIELNSDKAANSEGVLEVRSRLVAQKDFSSFFGYTWIGFNYRGEGRSFLLPWGVGAQFRFNRLRLGAELFGFQSVTDDSSAGSSSLRSSYVNNVNAGSFKFYGKNPSLVDTNLYATWLLSKKWSLQASAGTTVFGSNAASGFHLGGLIRYSFDLNKSASDEPAYSPIDSQVPGGRANMYNDSELSSEKKVQRFQEQTDDGVDQSIFQKRPTKSKRSISPSAEQGDFEVKLKSQKKKKKH